MVDKPKPTPEPGHEDSRLEEIGRLAMRRVDNWYVAYYAMPDTMDNAIELGRMHFRFVEEQPLRQHDFIALMRACVSDLIQERFGLRPEWPTGTRPAPPEEATGKAAPNAR